MIIYASYTNMLNVIPNNRYNIIVVIVLYIIGVIKVYNIHLI